MALRVLIPSSIQSLCRTPASTALISARLASSAAKGNTQQDINEDKKALQSAQPEQKKTKTQTELDEELKKKMAGISGDGGEAGVELEDGQPVSMKRSVRNNMFRYI